MKEAAARGHAPARAGRLFPEASPAAAMALPRTPEDLAHVGHWAVITRDPDLYERLPEVAPAFARP